MNQMSLCVVLREVSSTVLVYRGRVSYYPIVALQNALQSPPVLITSDPSDEFRSK